MFESPSSRSFLNSQETELRNLTTGLYTPPKERETGVRLVLASLQRYWYVSAAVSALIMAGVLYKTTTQPKIYKSDVQIAIELKSAATLAEKLTAAAVNDRADAVDERSASIETTIQKLKSKALLQKAIDSIEDRRLRPTVDSLLSNMSIQPGQNTNILTISYHDTNPQQTVNVLNALTAVYIDYGIGTKKARINNSIKFIESQLPKSRERLSATSKKLGEFRYKYRFIDPESSARSLTEYRQDTLKKINESGAKYNELKRQQEKLNQQLAKVGLQSNNTLSTTMLNQDTAYQELFRKFNELDLQYSQERLRLTDDSPILQAIKSKREDVLKLMKNRAQQVLQRQVDNKDLTNGSIANFGNNLAQNLASQQAEIESNLAAQSAQYQSLYKVSKQIETQIGQLPVLQQQYTDLQRQYTIASQELTAFLQKLQELKLIDAEQVVPWTLIDPPEVPKAPIFPNVGQQLVLGSIGSLLLGVLSAVGIHKLRSLVDRRIDRPDELKAITGMPLLTLVPKIDDSELLTMRGSAAALAKVKSNRKSYGYWSFIEAMRMLVLDIGLMSDDDERVGKAIAMTSAVSKEGKSTISFHSAITLAELGYRVLLVDADLHKSSIASLCRNSPLFQSVNCADDTGLSDVILLGDSWEAAVKRSPNLKLDVLFSGVMKVNSIALLNSPRFKRSIAQWRKQYDYIIFDTPPIVGLSDTRLIAKLVDGLVYIVSLNVAKRQTIDRAIEIISSLQTPVLGLAINRARNPYSEREHEYYKYSEIHDAGAIENISPR